MQLGTHQKHVKDTHAVRNTLALVIQNKHATLNIKHYKLKYYLQMDSAVESF